MSFLKKHWGTIVAVGGTIATYIDWNQVAGEARKHQYTALGIILSVILKIKMEKGFGQ